MEKEDDKAKFRKQVENYNKTDGGPNVPRELLQTELKLLWLVLNWLWCLKGMEIVCGRFTVLISGCDRVQGLVCSSNSLFFIISRQYISGTMLCIVKRCSVS